jgi:nitrile hydratase
MSKAHDRGGWPTEEPIDQSEHPLRDWERRLEALGGILAIKKVMRLDEVRRAQEELEPAVYESIGYYDRRLEAVEALLLEKNILSKEEIDRKANELDQLWEKS